MQKHAKYNIFLWNLMTFIVIPIVFHYFCAKSLKNNTKSFIFVKTSDHHERWTGLSGPRAQRAGFQNSLDLEVFKTVDLFSLSFFSFKGYWIKTNKINMKVFNLFKLDQLTKSNFFNLIKVFCLELNSP